MGEILSESDGVRVIRTDDGRVITQDIRTGRILSASGTPEQAEKAREAKKARRDYTLELLALLGYNKENAPIDVLLLAEVAASGNLRALVLYRKLVEESKNKVQPKELNLSTEQIKVITQALAQRNEVIASTSASASASASASGGEGKKRAKPERQEQVSEKVN